MSHETILEEAQRIAHGDRGTAYGHPYDDMTRTGRMWGAIIDGWLRAQPGFEHIPPVPDVPARIGVLFPIAMKLSREVHAPKRDNRVDTAGWAHGAQRIAEREAELREQDGAA